MDIKINAIIKSVGRQTFWLIPQDIVSTNIILEELFGLLMIPIYTEWDFSSDSHSTRPPLFYITSPKSSIVEIHANLNYRQANDYQYLYSLFPANVLRNN